MRYSLCVGVLISAMVVLASCQCSQVDGTTVAFGTCNVVSQPVRSITTATGTVYLDKSSQRSIAFIRPKLVHMWWM